MGQKRSQPSDAIAKNPKPPKNKQTNKKLLTFSFWNMLVDM